MISRAVHSHAENQHNANQRALSRTKQHKANSLRSVLACLLAFGAIVALSTSLFTQPAIASTPKDDSSIVIVCENDVHCAITETSSSGVLKTMGYARFAGYVNTVRASNENVAVVSDGDFLSGSSAGTLTTGQAPIDIMNLIGYDVVTMGNHDFDFTGDTGIALLRQLRDSSGNPTSIVDCNLARYGTQVFDAYTIKTYTVDGSPVKVAFVGIITPETLVKTSAKNITDSQGNIMFDFSGGDAGAQLYAATQNAVDEARNNGADYVIALAHLGYNGETAEWTSATTAAHTHGIDAIIDGHSHETYIKTQTNDLGNPVTIIQTGTQLANLGTITIDPDAETPITAQLIDAASLSGDEYIDATVAAKVADIQSDLDKKLGVVVGTTDTLLAAKFEDGSWATRSNETNLGDFVCDAILSAYKPYGADCAIISGGSIRTNIAAGPITKGNLLDVCPFGNFTCCVEVTGQQLADALEMGARAYPNLNAGFLQIAGITYTLRTDIQSSVEVNEKGEFVAVSGQRRVQNIKIGGTPINLNARYRVASISYLLAYGGDGYSMFKDGSWIVAEGTADLQVLIDYITNDLNGVVGSEYANCYQGQGRITFSDHEIVDPTPNPSTGESELAETGDETPYGMIALLLTLSLVGMLTASHRNRKAPQQ